MTRKEKAERGLDFNREYSQQLLQTKLEIEYKIKLAELKIMNYEFELKRYGVKDTKDIEVCTGTSFKWINTKNGSDFSEAVEELLSDGTVNNDEDIIKYYAKHGATVEKRFS